MLRASRSTSAAHKGPLRCSSALMTPSLWRPQTAVSPMAATTHPPMGTAPPPSCLPHHPSGCIPKVNLYKTLCFVFTILLDSWLNFAFKTLTSSFFFPHVSLSTRFIFPDNANHTSGINTFSNPLAQLTQHSSAATVTPVSPTSTSCQRPAEDQQSFVSLTPPLNLSVDGEEYLLSLAEDEGITDLFSSFDLEQLPLDLPV